MNFTESKCQCKWCRNLCSRVPCLGTPDEMQAIMSAFPNRLVVSTDNDPSLEFIVARPRMEYGKNKGCTFFKNGNCELHAVGLKPIEGRVTLHGQKNPRALYRMLAQKWNTKKGRALVHRIENENNMTVGYPK